MSEIQGSTTQNSSENSAHKDTHISHLRRFLYRNTGTVIFYKALAVSFLSAIRILPPELNHLLVKDGNIKIVASAVKPNLGQLLSFFRKDEVGMHMSVRPRRYASLRAKHLSDGIVLKPGDVIGEIDITDNLPTLGENQALIGLSRRLYRETQFDLRVLARLCETNEKYKNIQCFHGLSHLAGPLATRMGFDTYKVRNPFKKYFATFMGKCIAFMTVRKSKHARKILKNFKPVNEAYISREKLLQMYGSQQETTQQTN